MSEWGPLRKTFYRYAEIQVDAQREQEAQEAIRQEISQRTWYTVREAARYLKMDDKEFRKKKVDTDEIPTVPVSQRGTKIHHTDLYNYVIRLRQRKEKNKS
jgi:hypothetical protein